MASQSPGEKAARPPPWRREPNLARLREAAAMIGTTLDLSRTAAEVVDAAVPDFADAATVFVAERLLAADEFASPPSEQEGTVVRRMASRVAGQPQAVTHRLLRSSFRSLFAACATELESKAV